MAALDMSNVAISVARRDFIAPPSSS